MMDPALRHWCECTLCQERADEIDRLRAIAIERMAWFKQAADNVELLDAQLASARKALDSMSAQLTSSEMDEDQRDHADWQGGYDAMVIVARVALDALTDEKGES